MGNFNFENKGGAFSSRDIFKDFGPGFLNAEFCREWVLRKIHPAGVVCPGCSEKIQDKQRTVKFWNGERLSCGFCGKKFTALTGTFLSGTRMNFEEIICLVIMLKTGAVTFDIANKLGCDVTTVRKWRSKLG